MPRARKSAPKVQALSTKLSRRNTGRKHCSCCKVDQFCADSSARSEPLRRMELSNAPFMSVASTCWQHWDHKIREEGESLEFATWILPEIVFRLSDWDFGIMRCWDTFFDRAGFAVESMFLTLTELRRGQIGANTRYQPIRDTTGGQDAGSTSSQRL